MANKIKKSFTLVELMIVIAILAILSAIVIFALNPARLFDNFRDSKRVTDISSINKAIVFMESWNQSGITYGTTTNVYISLPDSNPSCTSYTLPTLPTGYTYYCSNATSYKNTNGTGWIPINFTVEGSNRYLSSLPVDPVNNTSFFYTYYPGGSYELTAILSNPNKNSINDEGSLTSTFEIGSPNRTFNTPLQRDKGLLAYWDFNESSGNIFYDKSGNGRNLNADANRIRTTLGSGEIVLRSNAAGGITLAHDSGQDFTNGVTAMGFVNMDGFIDGGSSFLSKMGSWANGGWTFYCLSAVNKQFVWGVSYNGGPGTTGNSNNATGTWYFAAGIYNPVNYQFKMFLNGAPAGNNSLNPVVLNASGNDAIKVAGPIGYYDDMRVYNRVLTQEEIIKHFNLKRAKYGL